MSGPKNIDQGVNLDKYGSEFDRIFGQKDMSNATGTYVWDSNSRCLVKLDTTTPKVVRDKIEPMMQYGVRKIEPVPVVPKV